MSANEETGSPLIRVLEQHTDEIAQSWTDLIYQISSNTPEEATRQRTLRLTRGSVLGIAHAWRSGSYAALEEHLNQVHQVNMQVDARIDWVIESLLLMTDAALPVIMRTYAGDPAAMADALAKLDLSLRWMTGYLAKMFADERSRHLLEQQERAEQMLDIAKTVSSTLELESVLDYVLTSLSTAIPGSFCRLFLVEEGVLVPAGSCPCDETSECEMYAAEAVNSRTSAIHRLDAAVDPKQGPTPCAEDARHLLAIPFLVRDRPVAAAVLVSCKGSRTFSEADLRIAGSIASIVAPVIDHARRHQQVEQATIQQERKRLSRELHDNLAQALSILHLQVLEVDGLLASNQLATAHAKLQDVKGTINGAYTDVREGIFNLRHAETGGSTFLAALEEYLSDYRLHYGVDAGLVVDARTLPKMEPNVQLQLIRIIQEALSNVRKHAQVDDAQIEISTPRDRVQVSIQDRGVGFEPTVLDFSDRQHYGLQIMQERAESVGGCLEIEAAPGRGTRIVVQVPSRAQE